MVLIGDSLDRRIVEYVCDQGFDDVFHLLPMRDSNSNTAPGRLDGSRRCTNHAGTTIGHLRIFGLHHTCSNQGLAARLDNRHFNTTSEQVQHLLPTDIGIDKDTNSPVLVFLIASSLWDLSEGCNNEPTVSSTYREEYVAGIRALHETLTAAYPHAMIYWRTSPPMSQSYSENRRREHKGRTRDNQKILNALLQQTVVEENLGTVVDWWAQLSGVPDRMIEEELRGDGRHYSQQPALAFFNMWLNAVNNQNPDLFPSDHQGQASPFVWQVVNKDLQYRPVCTGTRAQFLVVSDCTVSFEVPQQDAA